MARKRSSSRNRGTPPAEEAAEKVVPGDGGEEFEASEAVYRRVGREVLTGDLQPACWARALAESEGGHDAALATYARLRSAELTRQVQEETRKKRQLACRVARAYCEPAAEVPQMEPIVFGKPTGIRGAMDAIFWHCVAIVGAVGCLLGAQLVWPGTAAHLTVERILLIVFAFQLFPVLGWVAAGRNGFYSALSYPQATHLSACVAVVASFGLGAYLLLHADTLETPRAVEQTPAPLLVVMPEEQIMRPVVHVEETAAEPRRFVSTAGEK